MDEWDQEKLEAVVNQKHGTEKNRPTDIICKFFLDAVERKQYGWCASLPFLQECGSQSVNPESLCSVCSCGPPCTVAGPLIHILTKCCATLQVLAVPEWQGVQVQACATPRLCAQEPDEGNASSADCSQSVCYTQECFGMLLLPHKPGQAGETLKS